MECLPSECAMKMEFSITDKPNNQFGPEILSGIQGELSISIDGKKVFNERDILLLELAVSLKRWLSAEGGDFSYESMDYEESPIIEFKNINGRWAVSSIWMEEGQPERLILHDELVNAVRGFIYELKLNLADTVTLDHFL